MNTYTKISIIGVIVVAFVLLLYYFGGRMGEQEFVTDKWEMTYDPADKGPYGTYMLKELLDTVGMFGNFLEMNVDPEDALQDEPDQNDIYFFVGEYNYIDEESSEFLFDFIAVGNTVFMACDEFPWDFMSWITRDADSVLISTRVYDSTQTFRFTHSELRKTTYPAAFIYDNARSNHDWYYLNPDIYDLYDSDTLVTLGESTQHHINFLKIYYGDGLIYLHSSPYLFTNIAMMKKSGFDYVEKVLQHIPPGRVQWDRYNLINHWSDNNDGGDGDGDGGNEKRQSIIQFILANPPLAWAFFILVAGALLYAVFKGKRLQKVIPAAEAKDNTSLEYINTLASLYMQERKHHKLVRLKEKTFLNFIADHYFIITKEADAKFISKVAVKSQIPEEKIKEIFELFRSYEQYENLNDDQLILLHQKIEYFYKNCR